MSSTTIEQSGLLSQKKNQTDSWNPPVPLTHGLNNETPYPFDALPNRGRVEELTKSGISDSVLHIGGILGFVARSQLEIFVI